MKKLKALVKNLRIRYYLNMINYYVDVLESTQLEYGESHKESLKVLKTITKYQNKLDKINNK